MNSNEWDESRMLLVKEFNAWIRKRKTAEITRNSNKRPSEKEEVCRIGSGLCIFENREPSDEK
jgi:hypothetical protein